MHVVKSRSHKSGAAGEKFAKFAIGFDDFNKISSESDFASAAGTFSENLRLFFDTQKSKMMISLFFYRCHGHPIGVVSSPVARHLQKESSKSNALARRRPLS